MELFTNLNAYHSTDRSAVTLGKFDGLHQGHYELIELIQKYKQAHNDVKSIIFVMDMTNYLLEKGLVHKLLMTNVERQDFIKKEMDCLMQLPFSHEFALMEPLQFIKEILVDKLHVEYIAVGEDYRFGHQAKGDVNLLKKYAKQYHYQIDVIKKKCYHDRIISSTYIRECLETGEINLANKMLGYSYEIGGIVERGKQLGRTIGFPTMNVTPSLEKMLPKNGVYTCEIKIDNNWYHGIANVGKKPTVKNDDHVLVEVNVFGYHSQAYSKEVTVRFSSFLRSEKKFSSIEELKDQISKDVILGKTYFAEKL